jgi:hypothetical protein
MAAELLFSRYVLFGATSGLGYTELTEHRRPDGSRSYLARERMEFWGPVLDRFVVLTFDPRGEFDSGHWVGTSEYSGAFSYTFRFDGRAIRGDWEDDVRGSGRSEVPSRPGTPVVGFWGPLEARLLARFNPAGPDRQTFEAVDVEDSHHRLLDVTVERVGREPIEVPAGRFDATHYRTERFGSTDHWIDDQGTLIRWRSEGGTYRWDLERYPSTAPLVRAGTQVASGTYDVVSQTAGISGTVPWRIERSAAGDFRFFAEERLAVRTSRFEGWVDDRWRWKGSTETVSWLAGEGTAPPERHHLELFFFRDRLHLLRFRDRAYPLLQSRATRAPAAFTPINYPMAAMTWLRELPQVTGKEQSIADFGHIANRYRGGGLEVQPAKVTYLGRADEALPSSGQTGHHILVRYPGGWEDSRLEFWTDDRFVPQRVTVTAGEGEIQYRLRDYRVASPEALR